MDWLDQLPGTAGPMLDAVWNGFVLVYGWAKEWQILLAGLLVLSAALILARAIRKTASRSAVSQPIREPIRAPFPSDLRLTEKPAQTDPPGAAGIRAPGARAPEAKGPEDSASEELVGSLEQLRSVIRSALASFTLTANKENTPALFLCQRIAHLKLERFALPLNAGKAAREQHAALLQQLELLRVHLKKDAPLTEISEILVRLNASARNLAQALIPAGGGRRQANSEPR